MKCIINQGIPGSGKTTSVQAHLDAGHIGHTQVCSSDSFFMQGGEYEYKPEYLGAAHFACYSRFEKVTRKHRVGSDAAFALPADFVFVDNTNTSLWMMFPYIQLAYLRGYEVEVHTFKCSVETAAARNVHGVPLGTIEDMAKYQQAPLNCWPCTRTIHHDF